MLAVSPHVISAVGRYRVKPKHFPNIDKNTKYIVASNLTAAYFAGLEHRYIQDPRRNQQSAMPTQAELDQPFNEVISVWRGFLESLDERYPQSKAYEP